MAAGGVALMLILAVVLVVISQTSQPSAPSAAPDRHARGNPQAAVTITEWSDFL